MNLKEALQFAENYDEKLLASDDRFRNYAIVEHQDGSRFEINGAFFFKEDNWIFLFTEHHRFFVFDETDLINYRLFKRIA